MTIVIGAAMKSKSPVKSKSPLPPVPMGPFIHPGYDPEYKHDQMEEDLMKMRVRQEYFQWLGQRILAMSKQMDPLRQTVLDDCEDSLKYYLKRDPNEKIKAMVPRLLERLKLLQSTKEVIDDTTRIRQRDVGAYTVSKYLFDNRSDVAAINNSLKKFLHSMQRMIETKKVTNVISKDYLFGSVIADRQKYLDALIKDGIFTEDEIYVQTLGDPHIFDRVKQLFKEYSKVYKEVKGKSVPEYND